jgi:predicted transcriptional regulator
MAEMNSSVIELTSDIVAAFVSNNSVQAADLPDLIRSVHNALGAVLDPTPEPESRKEPAVPVKKSITPEAIICLEDGRKFKSLKRHLRTAYDMTPEQYRAKWGLPRDYPMVAPAYAAARSKLAKQMGLGQGGRQPAKAAPVKRTARAKA